MKKFFIGARDLDSGLVILAETIEAKNFGAAWAEAEFRARKESLSGRFEITAVNEQREFITLP